jgi:DNA modification methylase
MKTTHRIYYQNAANMRSVDNESVDLVVTSPPYPMIEMWDASFTHQNRRIGSYLKDGNDGKAFEGMHRVLDAVWDEVQRVLKIGGIACINIGDATRKLKSDFKLYPNHSRILTYLTTIGMNVLPVILWRKQTNAPNKFMGSGMMPPGAYVTLEHEYILILRKGPIRVFSTENEKHNRRESAYFWEERNTWFSDVWFDIKGTGQSMAVPEVRKRSAAFPFELAYRLINMFSVKGDTVLDPFLGTATTMHAAAASARNSIGFEIEADLEKNMLSDPSRLVSHANELVADRLARHRNFVLEREAMKGPLKHANQPYGFSVVTAQEKELFLDELVSIKETGNNTFDVLYGHREETAENNRNAIEGKSGRSSSRGKSAKRQLSLFR